MINWEKKICMRLQLANSVKVDTSKPRILLGSLLANQRQPRYGAIEPARTGSLSETHQRPNVRKERDQETCVTQGAYRVSISRTHPSRVYSFHFNFLNLMIMTVIICEFENLIFFRKYHIYI